jgi:hypothetical protein
MPNDRFSRQSFLGPQSKLLIESTRVGIVGLGGGGSHVAQQLAHVGVVDFVIYDGDRIEDTNLNRLIGATEDDVRKVLPKTDIATRLIKGVRGAARVMAIGKRWQVDPIPLRSCDVVFGSVDTFLGRHELEVLCRRYLIPYIDIGMDVHIVPLAPPRMAGQVIASIPGHPCMRCLYFLNDGVLGAEAARYGDVGGVPQVVWANGQLASAAVGMWIDMLTGWTGSSEMPIYLSYDGNKGLVTPHRLTQYAAVTCPHYPFYECGDPVLKTL